MVSAAASPGWAETSSSSGTSASSSDAGAAGTGAAPSHSPERSISAEGGEAASSSISAGGWESAGELENTGGSGWFRSRGKIGVGGGGVERPGGDGDLGFVGGGEGGNTQGRGGGVLLAALGEFLVAGSLFLQAGLGVHGRQGVAAAGSIGEALGADVQGGEALVEAHVAGRDGQHGHQRAERLIGHVVGNEKLGVGKGGAERAGDLGRVVLVEGRRGGFEFLDQHDALFDGEQLGAGGAAHHADHLLVVLHVDGVLRFQLGEGLVEFARLCQVAGLHVGVCQQFVDFGLVGLVPGLVEQV